MRLMHATSLGQPDAASRAKDADDLRLANYPRPYPDGWYRLRRSKSLRRGEVRYRECLGRALVVWRSETADEVFAMSPFCPHVGASLVRGRVCEDRIECRFHAWQFTGDERAARVPYSDTVPTCGATESFPVQEGARADRHVSPEWRRSATGGRRGSVSGPRHPGSR